MKALEVVWAARGDVLFGLVAGPMCIDGLRRVRSELVERMVNGRYRGAVLDLHQIKPGFTAQDWERFIVSTPRHGVAPEVPVALVVQPHFLDIANKYCLAMAKAGRVRCFFSDVEIAFSWVAWVRVRRSMLALASARSRSSESRPQP